MFLALRIAALVFGILGASGSLTIALIWRNEAEKSAPMIALARKLAEEVREGKAGPMDQAKVAEAADVEKKINRMMSSIPMLFVGVVMCLIGSVLAILGRTGCAAIWFLLAVLGPTILAPPSIICTGATPLAALIAGIATLAGAKKDDPKRPPPRNRRSR